MCVSSVPAEHDPLHSEHGRVSFPVSEGALVRVRYKGITDVGRKRESNEDCLAMVPEDHLFVVADGMGGHAAGEVAADLAVKNICRFIAATRRDAEITWPYEYDTSIGLESNRLKTAIRVANHRILEEIRQHEELEGMGTTVVGAIIEGNQAHICHVGDSRAYVIRNRSIEQITSDHSWVNEQVKLGFLARKDASHHPFRNVVTRALGSKGDVSVDVAEQELQPGDFLLLCSDGLNTMLDDDRIADTVLEHADDVEAAAEALVKRANLQGGEDNVTVILIKVDNTTPS